MMAFEHRAVRPHPQAVALPRLQGAQQFFTWQALELSELDLVQGFIPVKRPQGRLSHFQIPVYAAAHANYATLLPMDPFSFVAAERAVFRRLTTPEKIQRFLDGLAYNKERDGETCHLSACFAFIMGR